MAKWDNTLYVQWRDVDTFLDVVAHVFAEDGYQWLNTTPQISQQQAYAMQYGHSLDAPYWAVAWIRTPTEWTIVKTSPFQVLCETPPKWVFPRVAMISALLECAAIQVNIEDGAALYTVETDERGASCLIGARLQDVEWDGWFDRSLLPQRSSRDPSLGGGLLFNKEKAFVLNPQFNDLLSDAFDEHHDSIEVFGTCLTTLPAEVWDNGVQVEYLQEGKVPPVEGCVTAYFAAPTVA